LTFTDDSVSAIDTTNNEVIANINSGSTPNVIEITSDGSKAYVANLDSDSISVIDIPNNDVEVLETEFRFPTDIEISKIVPGNNRTYILNRGRGGDWGGRLSVIDVLSDTLIEENFFGVLSRPISISLAPDELKIYVANYNWRTASILAINLLTNRIQTVVGYDDAFIPTEITIAPNGLTAYVVSAFKVSGRPRHGKGISVIDTIANQVVATIETGLKPTTLTITPDGTIVFVADYFDNTVSVIDPHSNSVIDKIKVGVAPVDIVISSDSKKVYIANSGSNTITVLDAVNHEIIKTIDLKLNFSIEN
jgi:YVTN family beta-propeller protein